MQVALADREKQSMLLMGGNLTFTYDTPGPIEVDVAVLTREQKNQLLYNYRQGYVTIDPVEELLDSCDGLPALASNFVTPKERPIVNSKPPSDALEKAAQERKELKKLLNAHHATVKKNIANLPISQIKILAELEEEGKKRKGLLKLFNDLIAKHMQEVSKAAGGVDLADVPGVYAKDEMVRRSQNVSDVVESDVQQVTLIPSDEELEKANG